MKGSLEISIQGAPLLLLAQKAIYWKQHETLIISDVHLGKAGHFRKHGIPISRKIHFHDLHIINELILSLSPRHILLLGDLFHSDLNDEWYDFVNLMEHFSETKFTLIKGNHDIIEQYPETLSVKESLVLGPFSFTHQFERTKEYNISGHIHPGYRIKGVARQGISLPCFYFSQSNGVLPAFGQFTGIKRIKPAFNDRVFGIAEDQVVELM